MYPESHLDRSFSWISVVLLPYLVRECALHPHLAHCEWQYDLWHPAPAMNNPSSIHVIIVALYTSLPFTNHIATLHVAHIYLSQVHCRASLWWSLSPLWLLGCPASARTGRQAFTNVTVPMSAKKRPLYHRRRPSANANTITAITAQRIPKTRLAFLMVFFLAVLGRAKSSAASSLSFFHLEVTAL
jgi:hypothetical protein